MTDIARRTPTTEPHTTNVNRKKSPFRGAMSSYLTLSPIPAVEMVRFVLSCTSFFSLSETVPFVLSVVFSQDVLFPLTSLLDESQLISSHHTPFLLNRSFSPALAGTGPQRVSPINLRDCYEDPRFKFPNPNCTVFISLRMLLGQSQGAGRKVSSPSAV